MKNRSAAAILLVSAMLLASCGENPAAPVTETQGMNTAEETTAAVTEEDTGIRDSLPGDLDFGGAVVSIHGRGDEDSFIEIYTEQTGEVLDDAVYFRNQEVEDRLNVKIEPIRGAGWAEYGPEIQKLRSTIMAGENAYQLIAGWRNGITNLALEGCFRNLNDCRYLDTEKPWWTQSAVTGLNIGGKLYFVTGDISIITNLGGSYVMFMNDRIAQEYDVTGIADAVFDGTWTIDRLAETVKNVGRDINGDSKRDNGDHYGLILDLWNTSDAFLTASDTHQILLDKEGTPVYTEQTERLSKLLDKIFPLYYSEGYNAYMEKDANKALAMFAAGQGLFTIRELDNARTDFRGMEDSFTILPMPKLDEEQKQYSVCSYNGATLWGIPTSNPDPDAASAVLEAMASASYRSVTPVYFETCLQDKYARNEITIQMLSIIRDNMYLDCEYLYTKLFGETCYIVSNLISSQKTDVASWYAKNSSKIQKAIDQTIEKFSELE